jgi:trigger factor
MQVVEVSTEGLKRQYRVTVPASEIEDRVQNRLKRLSQNIKVPGFRPGKVPLNLLKKQYGRSVMSEVLEQAVDEGSRKAISDNELKPALRPKVEVTSFDEGKDLEFALDLEILPEVPQVDLASVELTRPVAEADEGKIDETLDRLAKSRQSFAPITEPRPAAKGDRVTIDFVGRLDGTAFEGGTAQDVPLDLGSGSMIPGFEEQIEGASAGEERTFNVTFPEEYPREELKGREVTFEVKVKEIQAPVPVEIDDAWAKELGLEDLAALRSNIKERIENEYKSLSRLRTKRQLLDHMAETYRFEVPAGMVDLEFDAIWRQLEEEMKRTGQTFESSGESEEDSRSEYRGIAERRVRLGLLLSDIGTRNDIKVEPQELQQAVMREAMRFQGQEKQVFEFYKNNPSALEHLRAPIFEDKVVDFIFQLAKIEDKPVSPEELAKDPDEDEIAAEPAASS